MILLQVETAVKVVGKVSDEIDKSNLDAPWKILMWVGLAAIVLLAGALGWMFRKRESLQEELLTKAEKTALMQNKKIIRLLTELNGTMKEVKEFTRSR